MFSSIQLLALKSLPKNSLSRFVGKIAEMKLPEPILDFWIRCFIRHYRIDMSEVEQKSFKSFNDFFTRSLWEGSRPIDESPAVSPVDGIVGALGKIERDTLFQAKGISYSLQDLVVNPEYAERFKNGHYVTLYLSPRHYHRIHDPVGGNIQELFYVPGNLYPVNPFAVHHVPGLFTLNERLLTLIENKHLGKVAVIKVGATIVGKIKVVYDNVVSNQKKTVIHRKYKEIASQKGDELGRFQMGSTVILLFEDRPIHFDGLTTGEEIRVGNRLLDLPSK